MDAHGGTPEPEGGPDPHSEGVGRDPRDGNFRYGARGHNPSDGHYPLAFHQTFALIGPLKRVWEYQGLLDQFSTEMVDQGLARFLRSVSPYPELITNEVVDELVGVPGAATMVLTDLATALGMPSAEPECIVLELLKRIHVNSELGSAHHCK